MLRRGCFTLAIGAFAFLSTFQAPSASAAGPGGVTMTVTALGKKDAPPPAISKEDVQLFVNKERTQIANWRRGEKLYLAVLIDDSLDTEVASQWNDLKEFFNAQPRSEERRVGKECRSGWWREHEL